MAQGFFILKSVIISLSIVTTPHDFADYFKFYQNYPFFLVVNFYTHNVENSATSCSIGLQYGIITFFFVCLHFIFEIH